MKTRRSWLQQEEQIVPTMHVSQTGSHCCSGAELGLSVPSEHPDHQKICKNKQNISSTFAKFLLLRLMSLLVLEEALDHVGCF